MNISGPNINEIIFSRTAKDLVVTDIPSNRLEIYFTYNDRKFGFEARTYNGTYTLKLSEVLKALEDDTIAPDVPGGGVTVIFPPRLKIEFLVSGEVESQLYINWVPGYCKENIGYREQLLNCVFWWTMRPQVAYTYTWSREILQLAVPEYFKEDYDIEICVDIHFAKQGKKRLTYHTIPYNAAARLVAVDVSYHHIENLACLSGYSAGHILAYDVIGIVNGEEDLPLGQRFIVAPKDRNVRGWFFRNSLGAFDTVYSLGSVARAIESDVKTFTTNTKELEFINLSKETYSIDTGYIKNQKELNLWYEFLRSTERYVILPDNTISRIIVDESDSKKILNEVGSLTFRCRMSEEVEGYGFDKSRLEDFSDGFT